MKKKKTTKKKHKKMSLLPQMKECVKKNKFQNMFSQK